MATDSSKTSFQQFEYCPLCKMSHKKRKKHIYSKHHQTVLNYVLKKYSLKISSVKRNLFSPVIAEMNYEMGAKFWCYFCVEEYSKHWTIEETCTVVGGGILEHIASMSHKEGMEKFFWDNLLNKKMKSTYVLSKEDLHIFKRAAFLAMKKFEKARKQEREKIAEKISQSETRRQVSSQSDTESDTSRLGVGASGLVDAPSTSGQQGRPGTREEQKVAGGKRTVSAYAPGLTCIIQEEYSNEDEGNIHTGALPPWLQTDDHSNQSHEIGPTLADYQKHLEREKKAKLPSMRVGAGFDHSAGISSDWLPSFGRVWSKGRRLQSRLHFEKELKLHKKGNSVKPAATYSRKDVEGSQNLQSETVSINRSEEQYSTNQMSHLHNEYSSSLQYSTNQMSDVQNEHDSASGPTHGTVWPGNSGIGNKIAPYKRKHILSNGDNMEANKKLNLQSVKQTDHCRPYERKSDISHGPNIASHLSTSGANQISAYMRKREESTYSQSQHLSLIQTPVLAKKS